MPVPQFKEVPPGGQVDPAELNRAFHAIEALSRVTGSRNTTVNVNSGGVQISNTTPDSFWAKITGSSSGSPPGYPWQQQRENADGSFSDDAEGRSGTATVFPAYELGLSSTVASGTVVRLFLSDTGDYYRFAVSSGGGGGTVVKCTGAISSGTYPGVVESFNCSGLTWSDGATCKLVGINSEALVNGTRYVGVFLCNASGVPVYGVTVSSSGGFTGTKTVIDSTCAGHTFTFSGGSCTGVT